MPSATGDAMIVPAAVVERVAKGEVTDPRVPAWATPLWRQLSERLSDGGFPCIFAKGAFERRAIWFCFAEESQSEAGLARIRAGVAAYLRAVPPTPRCVSELTVLLVMVRPGDGAKTLEADHREAWSILQSLHDHDASPWPEEIPTAPEEPLWSFCFAGVALFVNISSPGHAQRRSRNLGDALTLVIQPRANFDLVAGLDTPGGRAVRQLIRDRMKQYDGVDSPKQLGTYGLAENREWRQYALKDGIDEGEPPRCPLRIRRERAAATESPARGETID